MVFSLYDLQTEAVLYASGLCGRGTVFADVRFVALSQKYFEGKDFLTR